jgi:autotransporter-associated beta strand protein
VISSGSQTFSGNNTYTGATTIDSGATLQIGNGSTSGTLGAGAVTNNGTLSINRSNAITVANVISGYGSLTQAGSGTVTLTGTNTYTGSTAIDSGTTLQIGAGGTDGALASATAISIASSATLTYNLSTTTTSLSNTISGAGMIGNLALGTTLNLSGATLSGFSAGTYQVNVDETTSQPTYSKITLGTSPSLGGNTFKVITTSYQSSFTAFDVFSWTGTATGTPTLNLNGATVTSGAAGSGGTLTYYANSGVTLSASNKTNSFVNSSGLAIDAGALQNSLIIEIARSRSSDDDSSIASYEDQATSPPKEQAMMRSNYSVLK